MNEMCQCDAGQYGWQVMLQFLIQGYVMAVIFISLPSAGCHHRHFSEEEEVSTVNKLEVRVNANLGVFFIGDIYLHTDLGFGYHIIPYPWVYLGIRAQSACQGYEPHLSLINEDLI